MANPKSFSRLLKVFLCHANPDASAARELYMYLNERGAEPWLDSKRLIGGQYWKQEISEAINSSDAIIICLSKNSFNRQGYIQTEIKFALEKAQEVPRGNIFIIPVKLEECDVPFELHDYQWVDLFEPDGHEKVLRSLQARAKQLAGITVPFSQPTQTVKEESVTPPINKSQASPPKVVQKLKKRSGQRFPNWNKFLLPMLFVIVLLAILGVSYMFKRPPTMPTTGGTVEAQLKSIIAGNDGMELIHVPAGSFVMGNDGTPDASPAHTVTLASFRIDQHEVTNAQYLQCVTAGLCAQPLSNRSSTRVNYYNNNDYRDFPVINVSWNDAKTYCEWAGRRLPTEAEWEKAARGVDAFVYPWGNSAPNDSLLNFNNPGGDTVKVATKFGYSPYQVFDLAGNVTEWVNDWYGETYYRNSPSTNPEGPVSGTQRVVRGGSFKSGVNDVRTFVRDHLAPEMRNMVVGFRCAMNEK